MDLFEYIDTINPESFIQGCEEQGSVVLNDFEDPFVFFSNSILDEKSN